MMKMPGSHEAGRSHLTVHTILFSSQASQVRSVVVTIAYITVREGAYNLPPGRNLALEAPQAIRRT